MRHNPCIVEKRDYGLPQYIIAFNCSTQPTLNFPPLVCCVCPILLLRDLGSFGFVSQNGYHVFIAVASFFHRQRDTLVCHHLRLLRRQHGGDFFG